MAAIRFDDAPSDSPHARRHEVFVLRLGHDVRGIHFAGRDPRGQLVNDKACYRCGQSAPPASRNASSARKPPAIPARMGFRQ